MEKMDDFLRKRLERYDQWLSQGLIPYSSKVLPVGRSLDSAKEILSTEQVFEVLKNARTIALVDCVCRTHYKRCDHPVDICFMVDKTAEKSLVKGDGRRVSLEEAAEKLAIANERGLVHQTLRNPDQPVYAVCSCCSCCCHDLLLTRRFGRPDLTVRSRYVAETDPEACTHCGECVDRCLFQARSMSDGDMRYDPAACYGCGLCVTTCPAEATAMKVRQIEKN